MPRSKMPAEEAWGWTRESDGLVSIMILRPPSWRSISWALRPGTLVITGYQKASPANGIHKTVSPAALRTI